MNQKEILPYLNRLIEFTSYGRDTIHQGHFYKGLTQTHKGVVLNYFEIKAITKYIFISASNLNECRKVIIEHDFKRSRMLIDISFLSEIRIIDNTGIINMEDLEDINICKKEFQIVNI